MVLGNINIKKHCNTTMRYSANDRFASIYIRLISKLNVYC